VITEIARSQYKAPVRNFLGKRGDIMPTGVSDIGKRERAE
jgi:hypothetical protein